MRVEIQAISLLQDAFRALIRLAPDVALYNVISINLMHSWFCLASTPAGQALDSSLLLDPMHSSAGQVAPLKHESYSLIRVT